jgi:tRNA-Thr(GGU) m(6)t(6)A37 methyltransferase TsaA
MAADPVELSPIGRVESELDDAEAAPKQGDEGAPDAWLAIEPAFAAGLDGLRPGDDLLVFTWLDRADRDVLAVHPRGERSRPRQGVFATRSPHRPNPIGLHRVRIIEVEGNRLLVGDLEALDETPILDLKPLLSAEAGER